MQLTSCVTCSNSPGISGSFFSFVQWVTWTRFLVDSGRKVLDSNIPSIFCRFSCVLSLVVSSQKNRWDDFQSSTESVNPPGRASPQGPQHMGEPKVPSGTSTVRSWGDHSKGSLSCYAWRKWGLRLWAFKKRGVKGLHVTLLRKHEVWDLWSAAEAASWSLLRCP